MDTITQTILTYLFCGICVVAIARMFRTVILGWFLQAGIDPRNSNMPHAQAIVFSVLTWPIMLLALAMVYFYPDRIRAAKERREREQDERNRKQRIEDLFKEED